MTRFYRPWREPPGPADPIDSWNNEGGAPGGDASPEGAGDGAPPPAAGPGVTQEAAAELHAAAAAAGRATLGLRRKRREDTEAGCRAHALADLDRAAHTGIQMRWLFEHSAAAWEARAELLGEREARFGRPRRAKP